MAEAATGAARPIRRRARAWAAVVAICAGTAAPTAEAGFFPAETIDGPSADVERLGGVDLARDGRGALVYTKRVAGVSHVFAASMKEGMWAPPERIDVGQVAASSEPRVATGNDGRVAIVWMNAGRLYGSVRPDADSGFSVPRLIDAGPAATASQPSLDMSMHGVAYVAFTATAGGADKDVRVARLPRGVTEWSTIDAPMDSAPAPNAGTAGGAPRIAASADGTALVAWEAQGSDGRIHVWARRAIRTRPGTVPQEVSVPSFEGRAGGSARAPALDIQDDSSFAWVAIEQAFSEGTRVIARRLVGSELDPPRAIDSLAFPAPDGAGRPRLDLTGRGDGLAAMSFQSFATVGATLREDVFAPGTRLNSAPNAVTPLAVPAIGEDGDGVIAWRQGPGAGGGGSVQARFVDPHGTFGAEATLAGPDALADLGLEASADREGDAAIAVVAGDPSPAGLRRVLVAVHDAPPSVPEGPSDEPAWRSTRRPQLRWEPSQELWGPVRYRVEMDGLPLATTSDTSFTPATPLREGRHALSVVALDRRGQEARGRARLLGIDTRKPIARVRTARRGGTVRFFIRIRDGAPRRTSGIARAVLSFGDRRGRRALPKPNRAGVVAAQVRHAYAGGRRYTARLRVVDGAGNTTVVAVRVRGR